MPFLPFYSPLAPPTSRGFKNGTLSDTREKEIVRAKGIRTFYHLWDDKQPLGYLSIEERR